MYFQYIQHGTGNILKEMKKLILFISFTCFASGVLAQEYKPYRNVSLPMLKESHKIDSLFDSVFPQTRSKKTGFTFLMIDTDHVHSNNIAQWKQQDSTIYTFLPIDEYLKEAGYFKYKGYTIIVYGNKDTHNLFERTNKMRLFNFVPAEEKRDFDAFRASFKYKDGRFLLLEATSPECCVVNPHH